MGKDKAIEICKNLKVTTSRMRNRSKKIGRKGLPVDPVASKKDLLKIKKDLMSKYNITENDL